MVLLALAASLTSCATTSDADGCPNEQCREKLAATKARLDAEDAVRARQTAAAEACARAEARPAGVDPAYVRDCRLKRWQQSGIRCTDSRVGERLIQVVCDVPTRGGPPDFATASEMSQKRAATATLAAGHTYLIMAGEDQPVVNYASVSRSVACQSAGPLGLREDCNVVSSPVPVSATVRRHYELLTEADAAARKSSDVPVARQPQSARQLAQAYAGLP
jgi:hypothetical protein